MSRQAVYVGRTNQAILAGELDLSEWDDEELLRGQRKSKNGKFHGRPPKVVPMAVHHELVRRRISRADEILDETLELACLLLKQVIVDNDAPYADRIKAAGMVMDRVMGKAPDKVEIKSDAPWLIALQAGIVRIGQAEGEVVDADPWEEVDEHIYDVD
jgi:hypothetical protein